MGFIGFRLPFVMLAFALSGEIAQAQTADPHHADSWDAGPSATPGMPLSAPQGSAPAMGADMGRRMARMQPGMAGHGGMGMMFEHVEGRIAFLKAELKIADPQIPAWNAFAETMRKDAASMKAMQEDMMKGGMPTTAPDRLALHRRMMSARLAAMDRAEASMKPLYATLSPDQRKIFDQLMSGPMGMM